MDVTKYSFNGDLFKERLKQAIDKKRYKNAELSRMTGVSAATIGNYLNGNRTPRGFGDIVPVAKALNVSVDYLAGVVDYNYLDESDKPGSSYPKNYYDVVRLMNILIESFKGEADLSGFDNTVQLEIKDSKLMNFLGQQDQLTKMVGRALSSRAFSIALDDLNDKMRKTPLYSPIPDVLSIDELLAIDSDDSDEKSDQLPDL